MRDTHSSQVHVAETADRPTPKPDGSRTDANPPGVNQSNQKPNPPNIEPTDDPDEPELDGLQPVTVTSCH